MRKILIYIVLSAGLIFGSFGYAEATCGRSSNGGLCETKRSFCTSVVRTFKSRLNNCWYSNSKGCVSYYTTHTQMSDADFHGCKRRLYNACLRTCYNKWGNGDAGCNHHRSCGLFRKYL